jgi:hypothetical protein
VSGALRSVWRYLDSDLWEPLADFGNDDVGAPASLFGDLYGAAVEYLSPAPMPRSLEQASSDPDRARELFLALQGSDFASESAIVRYLEHVHELIDEYEVPGYADRFVRLMKDVQEKYNLRYRVEEPFELRFLLPASFMNLYEELYRHHAADPHLATLLADFEGAYDGYLRNDTAVNLKTCIHKASNYVEGVLGAANGSHGPMGKMCDQLQDWPHTTIKQSLLNIYGFCSEYPGIRHAGNPDGAHRELEARDLTLASVLLLSFSGYVSAEVDEWIVLGA